MDENQNLKPKSDDPKTPDAELDEKHATKSIVKLKQKKTWLIGIVTLLVIGSVVGYALTRSDKKSSVVMPDGTTKELSLEETAYTGVAADVLTNQTFECVPRNEHEWYRTDHTLVVDYKDPDTMYVSVEYKGIFKSVDGGNTWSQKTKGIKVYARSDDKTKGCYGEFPVIRMDQKDNKHLVIGLSGAGGGFLDATTPNSQVGGVAQTFDGGETWKLMINNMMNIYVTDVAIDPSDSKTVYYGTTSNPASWGGSDQNKLFVTSGLIYHTANSGKSWAELPTGIGKYTGATRVMVNPTNPKEIVAATFSAVRHSADGTGTGISNGKDSSGAQLGVLRTIDGGKTWSSTQLPGNLPIINAAYSERNFQNMYFMSESSDNRGRPISYVSLNAGKTFQATKKMDVVAYDPNDSRGLHLVGYSTVAGVPGDPSLNMFQSRDGGLSWQALGTVPSQIKDLNDPKIRPSKIVWHPTDSNTLFMSGAGGHVWKTTNLGKTWTTLLDLSKLPK